MSAVFIRSAGKSQDDSEVSRFYRKQSFRDQKKQIAGLLAGVYILNAVALVLEGAAVGTDAGPATVLALAGIARLAPHRLRPNRSSLLGFS